MPEDEWYQVIKDLAEKHNTSTLKVNEILLDYINERGDPYALQKLDFKDLDAIVQEGLVEQEMIRRQPGLREPGGLE